MENNILIIDDDIVMQKVISMVVKTMGFEPLVASTVAQAQKILEEKPVSLITCDMILPDIDGLDFLTMMKQSHKFSSIPVIIISAMESDEKKEKVLEAGAAAILSKPFNAKQLSETIKNWINL